MGGGGGVGSEMFAMASILSCLLPYWVLVNDVRLPGYYVFVA